MPLKKKKVTFSLVIEQEPDWNYCEDEPGNFGYQSRVLFFLQDLVFC